MESVVDIILSNSGYRKAILIAKSSELNNMIGVFNESNVVISSAALGVMLNQIEELEDEIIKIKEI